MTGAIDISAPTSARVAGMPDAGVSPQPPLLEVRDLSLSFTTARGALPITRNVNFTIAPGERVGLGW
jgi:peptide/nickel transport system ATP-binding protein